VKIQSHPSGGGFRQRIRLAALSACILLINLPTAVRADTSAESVSAPVSLAGLDLTKPAQLDIARERLAVAAKRLCMTFYDARKADNHEMFVDCYRESLADALERLSARLSVAQTEPGEVARREP
jgi:UrcA family protein